jgi:hypothetical protein
MKGTEIEEALNVRLNGLAHKKRAQLIAEFSRVYGKPPPIRISNFILALAIAYRLQEGAYGKLKSVVRKSLLTGSTTFLPTTASPGTMLIREWQAQKHVVTVHADRVEYLGKPYRSLTEVVFRITGQKRSGPLFFGLRKSRHRVG